MGVEREGGTEVRGGLVEVSGEVEEDAEVGLGIEVVGVGDGGSGELLAGRVGLAGLEVLMGLLEVLGSVWGLALRGVPQEAAETKKGRVVATEEHTILG